MLFSPVYIRVDGLSNLKALAEAALVQDKVRLTWTYWG